MTNWHVSRVWTLRFDWNGTGDKQTIDVVADDGNTANVVALEYFKKVFGEDAGSKFTFCELISSRDVVVKE